MRRSIPFRNSSKSTAGRTISVMTATRFGLTVVACRQVSMRVVGVVDEFGFWPISLNTLPSLPQFTTPVQTHRIIGSTTTRPELIDTPWSPWSLHIWSSQAFAHIWSMTLSRSCSWSSELTLSCSNRWSWSVTLFSSDSLSNSNSRLQSFVLHPTASTDLELQLSSLSCSPTHHHISHAHHLHPTQHHAHSCSASCLSAEHDLCPAHLLCPAQHHLSHTHHLCPAQHHAHSYSASCLSCSGFPIISSEVSRSVLTVKFDQSDRSVTSVFVDQFD